MLQQTQVATVIPYYAKFLAAYPSLGQLAAAPVEEVLGMWAGLGYYARARNFCACARAVAALGAFPRDYEGLRALPGIGPYTAKAIGAIAFALPLLPVDGNIERVAARVFGLTVALPEGKGEIALAAESFLDDPAARRAPGDFAQSLFDLGATICTPRSPKCGICPWAGHCVAARMGIAGDLPVRRKKPARPHRTGTVYVLMDGAGEVALIRRPPSGLLGGMLALPELPPVEGAWRDAGSVKHVFTHFSLTLSVRAARVPVLPEDMLRAPADAVALPSVMRKALDAGRRALEHAP